MGWGIGEGLESSPYPRKLPRDLRAAQIKGYRLDWGAHPLPSYRRLPVFSAIAAPLSLRDGPLKRCPPKSGQPALPPAAAPTARPAAPLTASGNECARNS